MKAIVQSYRRGKHTQTTNQLVLVLPGVSTKEAAAKFVGKKVVYNTGKKDIVGKITGAHGNSGAVRALFETGMPGQALATKVDVQA